MSFEVIKWVYNKTFVKIMKNTVHFRNSENSRLNKSDVKIGEDERFQVKSSSYSPNKYKIAPLYCLVRVVRAAGKI